MLRATIVPTLADDYLLQADDIVKLAAIGASMIFGVTWAIFGSWRRSAQTRQREMSRREIAAYVAEGSITAQDASVLLIDSDSETERQIASAVAWGTIKPEKAESLLRAARGGKPADSPGA